MKLLLVRVLKIGTTLPPVDGFCLKKEKPNCVILNVSLRYCLLKAQGAVVVVVVAVFFSRRLYQYIPDTYNCDEHVEEQRRWRKKGLVYKGVVANKAEAHDPSSYTLPFSKALVNNPSGWRRSLK